MRTSGGKSSWKHKILGCTDRYSMFVQYAWNDKQKDADEMQINGKNISGILLELDIFSPWQTSYSYRKVSMFCFALTLN